MGHKEDCKCDACRGRRGIIKIPVSLRLEQDVDKMLREAMKRTGKSMTSIIEREVRNMREATIIFDNGGGITLQLGEWAHWYNGREKQAADDLKAYLAGEDSSGWDGHEEDAADLNPSDEDIRNGGYRVWQVSSLAEIPSMPSWDTWGGNMRDFLRALGKITEEE